MNILLIFFALPIAVIIISIALQKILKCPALVAAVIFAIFLIVTFIISNLSFLMAAIVYTVISFITAYLVCVIGSFLKRVGREKENCCCRHDNGMSDEITNCMTGRNTQCCTYQITNEDGVSARINIIPNTVNQTCSCRRR